MLPSPHWADTSAQQENNVGSVYVDITDRAPGSDRACIPTLESLIHQVYICNFTSLVSKILNDTLQR